MKINFEQREPGTDRKHSYYFFHSLLATNLAQEIAGGITNIVATGVTMVVTFIVLLGGLWLAYTYLPENIFYIVLAVLIADAALGIILRVVFLPR